MEPLWMGLGQVAGTAAWMSIQENKSVGDVSVDALQGKLLEYRQILTYFNDLSVGDPAFQAVQFWGTKGFFDSYEANIEQPLNGKTWQEWETTTG
jgi:hypothetical protein